MRLLLLFVVLDLADDRPPEWDAHVKKLKSNDNNERIQAIEALAQLGAKAKPASAALCDPAMADFIEDIRKLAGKALIKVNPDLGVHVVTIRDERDPAKLIDDCKAIGKLRPTDGVAGTRAFQQIRYRYDLSREKDDIAMMVASFEAIGAVLPNDRDVVGELGTSAVLGKPPEVRIASAKAIGRIGAAHPNQCKVVIGHLRITIGTDISKDVKIAAIHAVGAQGAQAKHY